MFMGWVFRPEKTSQFFGALDDWKASMRIMHVSVVVMALLAGACGSGKSPGGASPGGEGPQGPGTQGTGGSAVGGAGGPGTGGGGGISGPADTGNGATLDANGGAAEDASTGTGGTDGGSAVADSHTPMSVDGAPPPSYEGEIPIYYGPPVAPIVQMDCPDDPTQGWTEYQDSFN